MIRRVSKMMTAARLAGPHVVIVSPDDELVERLCRLPVRVLRVARGATLDIAIATASVLLLDTSGESADGLRQLCALRAEPLLSRAVSAVLCDDEASLVDHRRIVGSDDAELRALDANVLLRRIRAWSDRGEERFTASLLQRALDASVNGICIADARVRGFPITYVSTTFERMTGYTRQECVGKNCRFMQHPDTSPDAVAALREALASGSRATVVLLNRKKDGTPFWNELTLVPITDERGDMDQFLGVQHDVTQLVTAQLLHRSSEERSLFLATLLDGVDALLTIDERACVTFANRAAEDLLGRPVATMLGANAADLLQLPEPARLAIRGRGKDPLEVSYELTPTDGARLSVHVALRPSEAEGTAWTVSVVSDAKRTRIDTDREQARRLVSLGSMLAGMSHEIRNPLATMSLLLSEVNDSPDPAAALTATKIKRQLDRVTRIVRDTSAYARPHPPRRSVVDARNVVTATIASLRSRIVERGIRVDVELGDAAAPVFADEKQLVQLLSAVVNNGLEAARSQLVVGIVRSALATTISIADDGSGIESTAVARVFDPFFTTKQAGTGLGLAIAQRLAEEHGGTLTLVDTSTRGTTFALTLTAEPILR